MSSSERLPSFKGPRDLSLSHRGGAQRDAGQARPKRVFTPNIPPKRDRGGITAATNVPSTSTSKTPSDGTNAGERSSRGRSQRGRGTARGGARPTKQRGELVQSESIFSDGVGDPLEMKRNSAMQYRSGYGSSKYKSATEGGPSRMSSMNRTTLNTLIKEEENDESNRKIFGTEKFDHEEQNQASSEDPNMPVVLPLIGYVPEFFLGPAGLDPAFEVPQPTNISNFENQPSTSSNVQSITTVIKQEKVDEADASPIQKIKKEKVDEIDTEKESERVMGALAAMSLNSISFAGTYRNAPKDGTLVYFQLPDELPVLEGSIRETGDQQDSSKSSTDLVQDINDLPEGFIGRLQILSSGRTRFILGENVFDVDSGRPVGFRQDLIAVDIENNKLSNVGPIHRKFVLTPDIECLIMDAL